MPAIRALTAACAALTLTSCIPLPHRSYRTPVIHGIIVSGKTGVPDLPVRVVAEPRDASPCTGKHALETRTDAKGAFAFCPMPDMQMFMVMMAHRWFRWNVCVNDGGEWRVVQRSSAYTLTDLGPRQIDRLECDLANPLVACSRSSERDIRRDRLRAALGTRRCAGVPD